MRLGDLEITLLDDGEFRLDGGAMFGVVPRTMWEKAKPPDARNRIRMATNCLLVARGGDLLLIDTGIGDKNDERFRDQFGMDPAAVRLPERLRRAGHAPEQVTHVLLTHLHFDHSGWNTRRAGQAPAGLVPTFPNAVYWLESGEVEHARNPNERDRASYNPENWEPLFAAGVTRLFDGAAGAEPIPGVRAVSVPGHNANMCIVLLDGGAPAAAAEPPRQAAGQAPPGPGQPPRRVVFLADLVPTAAHVAYPWIMSYDLFPLTTLANKKLWLPRAAAGNWLAIFQHEAEAPVGRIVEEKPGRFRAVPDAVALAGGTAAGIETTGGTAGGSGATGGLAAGSGQAGGSRATAPPPVAPPAGVAAAARQNP
jgi:glyoxylase-like metal-dependent hydrolase (beta-lactamase superfamily II)